MKKIMIMAAALTVAGPAHAQDIILKPLLEARARYETVSQDGVPENADALTLRLRGGVEAASGAWRALVEAQGTLAAVNHYEDGLHGPSNRPLVADPQNIALYRAQLQYRAQNLVMTVGRQRILFDDERFVGGVGFRDNGQSFDAVRIEASPIKGLKADVSYVWSMRTIWGIDGNGARQQAVSGNTLLGNLSYVTPLGTATAFAYLVDQDEAAVQTFRLSSQSYGVRLAGGVPLGKDIRLSWMASYATQSGWHRNPNRYRADYYLIDGTIAIGGVTVNAGYEILGAARGRDGGITLTSFQTPLATSFKFQGWADKFLTTPPNGVRDVYGGIGYGWKRLGPIDALSFQAVYHSFRSDRLDRYYGNEVDLLATARFGRTLISARYADYRAHDFATDTRKVWLQLDWTL